MITSSKAQAINELVGEMYHLIFICTIRAMYNTPHVQTYYFEASRMEFD